MSQLSNLENKKVSHFSDLYKKKWAMQIGLECYGVKLGFQSDEKFSKFAIEKIFPAVSKQIPFDQAENYLSLIVKEDKSQNGFYFNEEIAYKFDDFEDSFWEILESKIIVILALLSPPEYFYIHAGAVSVNNVGIIIPGESFSGKTTLVKKLIENGAEYYSDDCAVIDFRGNLHPFSNLLSIRLEKNERVFLSSENFGSENASKPVKVGMIIFTKFLKDSVWNPMKLSEGKAVFQLYENFFFDTSVRKHPAETLEFLSNLVLETDIYAGERGDAEDVCKWVFDKIHRRNVFS